MGYKKTKYKSEVDMCKDLTRLISGMIAPTRHKYIPEVPRSSHNNHSDMLFIKNNGLMFVVEYKLAGSKDLMAQIQYKNYKIGILNQKIDRFEMDNISYYSYNRLFEYTGEDYQLEKISMFLNGLHRNRHETIIKGSPFGYERYKEDELMIYWWSYKHSKSSLLGGIQNGKRESFFEVYIRAIVNMQRYYHTHLDFDLVYSVLGFYGKANARKHYNDAMKELLLDK